MNKLLNCNTYFQLIIAIQLKLTILKNDHITVFLSNHSINCDKVADKVKDLEIFQDLKIINTKHRIHFFNDIFEVLKYNFGKVNNINLDYYDEIIFHNYDLFMYRLADIYKKKAHRVIWSRMEEGLFSYETDLSVGNKVKLTHIIRKFTKRPDIINEIKNYYCFFPTLKNNTDNWNIIAIPSIKSEVGRIKEILNYIFDYKPTDYKQKYIFFASSSDIDGQSFGETELVLKIADQVGKENLLVKMHPRDSRDVYKKYGISVMENSYVPWEVIQLNWGKNEHILLTVNSGAFISITSLMNQNIKGYFLYSYVKNPNEGFIKRAKEISDTLEKLHSLDIAKNIMFLEEKDI